MDIFFYFENCPKSEFLFIAYNCLPGPGIKKALEDGKGYFHFYAELVEKMSTEIKQRNMPNKQSTGTWGADTISAGRGDICTRLLRCSE